MRGSLPILLYSGSASFWRAAWSTRDWLLVSLGECLLKKQIALHLLRKFVPSWVIRIIGLRQRPSDFFFLLLINCALLDVDLLSIAMRCSITCGLCADPAFAISSSLGDGACDIIFTITSCLTGLSYPQRSLTLLYSECLELDEVSQVLLEFLHSISFFSHHPGLQFHENNL